GLGLQSLASSRYLHIVAAMVLPALAVGVDAIVRRRQALLPVLLALLLVGIPGNVADADRVVKPNPNRKLVLTSLPRMALAHEVPRSLHPTLSFAAEVTIGWLLDGVESGRIPATRALTPAELANNTLRLSLEQVDGPHRSSCVPLHSAIDLRLGRGQSISVQGSVGVQLLADATHARTQSLPFGASLVATAPTFVLRSVVGPVNLRIRPQSFTAALC
ncbi:MAG TPA: hypothetical protein VEZ15_12570, partial [Acidimicrobiia bacterium]|nr:hypothetical protein [Acidimicrobiia bacterium]